MRFERLLKITKAQVWRGFCIIKPTDYLSVGFNSEKEGFEPSRQITPPNTLAVLCPLFLQVSYFLGFAQIQ